MTSLALLHDERLDDGIRRIARLVLDDALWLLEHEQDVGRAHAVHHTRKRCKEFRGLIRLTRAGIGDDAYDMANATTRDAARRLAGMRDRHAMLDTFDSLVDAVAETIPAPGVGDVRSGLRRLSMRASRPNGTQTAQIHQAHEMLTAVRDSIDEWSFSGSYDEILGPGLADTYERARRAMNTAAASMDPHDFHEWRKHVKYGWVHALVLHQAAPGVLGPMAKMRNRLADALGDAHDLTVILDTAQASPHLFGGDEQVRLLEKIIDPVRTDLERAALLVGRRLYVEETDAHTRRLLAYLHTWQAHGDEFEVGEIADLWPVDDHLDELSVDDLRQRAVELGVRGRWSMDRQELLRSLRARGESARGAVS